MRKLFLFMGTSAMALPILFQDEHYVVVDKPAGLLLHRSYVDPNATAFALQIVRDQLNQHVYPVHRLDRPTSGLLVFALSSEAARRLSAQFEAHQVEKRYIAVVRGFIQHALQIDYPLKEPVDKQSPHYAIEQQKPAQSAISECTPLAHLELPVAVGRYSSCRFSLVELNPKTGRRHQLRRHMKHIFHPIIGDTAYGDGKQNQFFRDYFSLNRLFLMAKRLTFNHPYTQQVLTIDCPFDQDFTQVLSHPWQILRDL